jgi:outer membrane receptor for ferrienterochelin and colicins
MATASISIQHRAAAALGVLIVSTQGHAAPATSSGVPRSPPAADSTTVADDDEGSAEPVADPPATVGAEVIVVTATRTATPAGRSTIATQVVTRDQIDGTGAQTAAQALAMQPGLWIQRGFGGAEVTLHGLGGKYVLLLVDGQRQIGRIDGVIDLDRFSTAEVAQIEIVNGPSSALYGSDALGGVINLIRRAPDQDRLHLATRYASDDATDVQLEATQVSKGWFASATGQWRRAPAVDRDPRDASTTISAYDERRTAVRLGHRATGTGLTRVELDASYLLRDLNGVDTIASGAVFDRRNLMEEVSGRLAATVEQDRQRLSLTASGSLVRDQYVNDQRGAMDLDQDQDTTDALVEVSAQLERVLATRHRASIGIEGMRETLQSPRLSSDGSRSRLGMFVQDQWERAKVAMIPAIRIDADSQFGVHFTPRLAAQWQITDRVTARSSFGYGYRAPSFKELLLRFENPGAGYSVDGNPDLDPESSRALTGSVATQPVPWCSVEVSTSWNELTSMITAVPAGADGDTLRFSYGNIARARTVDVDGRASVAVNRLRLEFGVALTYTRDLEANSPLPGVPPWRTQTAARWRDDSAGFAADLEFALTGSRSYVTGMTSVRTGSRIDGRARIAKSFGGRVSAFLGLDNLFDVGDDDYDPIAPRTAYVGLTTTH